MEENNLSVNVVSHVSQSNISPVTYSSGFRQRISDMLQVRIIIALIVILTMMVYLCILLALEVNIVVMSNYRNSSVDENSSYAETFDWNIEQQGILIGSYYWGIVALQVPSGIIANKLNAKMTFLAAMLVLSVGSLVSPVAAGAGYGVIVAVRVVSGCANALIDCSIRSILANWSPPNERTRMMMCVGMGALFGLLVGSIVTSQLGQSTFLGGWPAPFYIFGGCGLIVCLLIFIFVSSSPNNHPFITEKEKEYIVSSIKDMDEEENEVKPTVIPWKSILTSVPVWANAASYFGLGLATGTVQSEMPTYLQTVLNYNLKTSGFILGGLYLASLGVTVIVAPIVDYCLKRSFISTRTGRVLCTSVGLVAVGVLLILVAHIRDRMVALCFLFFLKIFFGLVWLGTEPNVIDLSPNFASVIFGITCLFLQIGRLIVPQMIGGIVYRYGVSGWMISFDTFAAINIITGILFAVFSSGDTQPWDKGQ